MLNKSYPYSSGSLFKTIKAVASIGLFIFLFMLIFRSEQLLENPTFIERLILSFYYGIIAFSIPFFNLLILNKLVSAEQETNWKVKNEITIYLLHFVGISIGNYFLSIFLGFEEPSVFSFLKVVLMTTVVGAIPVSIYVIAEQNKILNKNISTAKEMSDFSKKEVEKIRKNSIQIGDAIIDANELIFAESQRNYVRLVLANEKEELVRITMKNLEELLHKQNNLLRCHRAYFVNINLIEKIEGNAQGLTLTLANTSGQVPVSRSYIPDFKHAIRPKI